MWKVTQVLATAPGTPPAAARFTVRRPRAGGWFDTVSLVNLAAGNGSWDVRTTYASRLGSYFDGRWHPDRWIESASFDPLTGSGDAGRFKRIARC